MTKILKLCKWYVSKFAVSVCHTSEPAVFQHSAAIGDPRYFHEFYSDKSHCLGDLQLWANAPKYGGASGLEELSNIS
jgi:hypothetical protein